jgi:hypothetical protein
MFEEYKNVVAVSFFKLQDKNMVAARNLYLSLGLMAITGAMNMEYYERT